jgi:hypothetical protein
MQTEKSKDNAVEQLVNWSKWLITINLFSATGCIIGLKTAGEATDKVGIFFFAAILCFGLSIVCATLFVFLAAILPFETANNGKPKFIWLAKLQWISFTSGLLFVLAWIAVLSKVV